MDTVFGVCGVDPLPTPTFNCTRCKREFPREELYSTEEDLFCKDCCKNEIFSLDLDLIEMDNDDPMTQDVSTQQTKPLTSSFGIVGISGGGENRKNTFDDVATVEELKQKQKPEPKQKKKKTNVNGEKRYSPKTVSSYDKFHSKFCVICRKAGHFTEECYYRKNNGYYNCNRKYTYRPITLKK